MKERIDHILKASFELKTSDIHLTVSVPPVFRIHGELRRYGKDVLTQEDTEAMAKAMIPESLWEQFKQIGELDFSYFLPNVARYRVNAFRQRGSVALAIRTIPTKIPTIEELNMPDILTKILEKPQGLILVTGPTGSGKSTTLAAMINHMN